MTRRNSSTENTIAASLAILLLCTAFYVVWDLMQRQKKYAEMGTCEQNLKRLSIALMQYSNDWDNKLPPQHRWMDAIDNKYLAGINKATVFHCPAANVPYGYAMNRSVEGASLMQLDSPRDTVMLFETDSRTRNADGGIADMAQPRHGTLNCSYCDGHTHWVNPYARSHWKWSNGG